MKKKLYMLLLLLSAPCFAMTKEKIFQEFIEEHKKKPADALDFYLHKYDLSESLKKEMITYAMQQELMENSKKRARKQLGMERELRTLTLGEIAVLFDQNVHAGAVMIEYAKLMYEKETKEGTPLDAETKKSIRDAISVFHDRIESDRRNLANMKEIFDKLK